AHSTGSRDIGNGGGGGEGVRLLALLGAGIGDSQRGPRLGDTLARQGGFSMAKGTLIAAMNVGRAAEDEFHDWYDTEHLPERQRIPGFLVCERWIGAVDGKISVATYDLEHVGVLKSPAYLAIAGENLSPWSKRVTGRVERLMRFEGDQILPGDQLPPRDAG